MNPPLKPGDRVRTVGGLMVYGTLRYHRCEDPLVVKKIMPWQDFSVKLENPISGRVYFGVVEQCRRLRPKAKRREVWVRFDEQGGSSSWFTEHPPGPHDKGWVRFVEAKPRGRGKP